MTIQTPTWQDEPPVPPSTTQRAVPGTVIGRRYQLRAAIGHGGMGTVWHGVDLLLHRDVAVKEVLLPPGMPPSERAALYERTLREARAAAALSHPSVVAVFDVVTEAGRPWIVMELLNARSLADLIIADGSLSARAVAKIGVALLGALEVAHNAGVLHRDVKPANILICTDGRCVLTDFGVARTMAGSTLTAPGMVLGSPHFISPERAVGAPFGPPSDLFSLGVSLFTAVEGRPPFDRGDPFDTMRAVVEEAPIAPVRAGVLTPVLYGLLDKDPQRRWDVTTARRALRELLAGPLSHSAGSHTDPYGALPAPVGTPSPGHSRIGGRAFLPADPDGEPEAWPEGGGAFPPTPAAGPPPRPRPRPTPRRRPGPPTRAGADALASRIRRWPLAARLGLPVAILVLVTASILVAAGWLGGGKAGPVAGPSQLPSSAGPPFAVQQYQDRRGITVAVPADWVRSTGGSYVDFTQRQTSTGATGGTATAPRLRINVEPAGSTVQKFFDSAAHYLQGHCATPYTQVGLRSEVTLAGRPAAELEYTCGSGTHESHGIWTATVVDGKAYECYYTSSDGQYQTNLAVYQYAVTTFQLNLPS